MKSHSPIRSEQENYLTHLNNLVNGMLPKCCKIQNHSYNSIYCFPAMNLENVKETMSIYYIFN